MIQRRVQMIGAVLAALVVVSVLATPLCAATACTTTMHEAMATSGCPDTGHSINSASCDHVLTPLSVTAVTQAPTFEFQVAAVPVAPAPIVTADQHVTVAVADEPPRPPSPSPLRI